MTDKFKKADRRFVLSDSTVNVYGFRLLTEGYLADEFRKNPIGYYMHRREEGIALKWEDIAIEGDTITGVPIINLANSRGPQTCDEVENGFLNAASVGHIVVLEYSNDPALMLPGQTGPTITRWYNKECSLVDIPGNGNALTTLYDPQENPLNLADFGGQQLVSLLPPNDTWARLKNTLQLADHTTHDEVVGRVQLLAGELNAATNERNTLQTTCQALQQQLADLNAREQTQKVATLLQQALAAQQITVAAHDRLAVDYATNAPGLEALLAALPAYVPVSTQLKARADAAELTWTWADYERNDPGGKKLNALRHNDPARYQHLFDGRFGG